METELKRVNGKRVLVTGGCGFIGINLVQELLRHGANVTVLDLPDSDWSRIPKKVKRISADIMNRADLKGYTDGIEVIYHLAARTDIDGKSLDAYEVNYEGTKNLIKEADGGSVKRFVFYSTQLVVGLFNETRFIDETEPYRTKTHYGLSKIEGEKVVIAECKKQGFEYTIIRPTSVYGPWGEAPYKAFFQAIKARRYFHIGKANNLVSWVYVKNLVDMTILTSTSKHSANEIYFGNDFHPYTMREIVNTVAGYYKVQISTIPNIVITPIAYILGIGKAVGLNVPIYPFRLKNIKANYCYDIQKSVLAGYRPRYELGDGIQETLDWYEQHGQF